MFWRGHMRGFMDHVDRIHLALHPYVAPVSYRPCDALVGAPARHKDDAVEIGDSDSDEEESMPMPQLEEAGLPPAAGGGAGPSAAAPS